MKKLIIYGIVLCLLCACGKHYNKPGSGPTPDPGGLTRIQSFNNSNYTYDSLGRLVLATFSNNVTARTAYTYTKDSVLLRSFDGVDSTTFIYYLNKDSLAVRERYLVNVAASNLLFTFSYNADRQLTEQLVGEENSTPATHQVNYYSGGNMDSSIFFSFVDNRIVQFSRYEYYTDKRNWLSDAYNGISYTGAGNANLMKKETTIEGLDTTVMVYSYVFDANDRPVRKHIVRNGTDSIDLNYTWLVIH
jgi:hypothetical protein